MVRVERITVGDGHVRISDHLYCDSCQEETSCLITGNDDKDRCPGCHRRHVLSVYHSGYSLDLVN